MKKNNSSYYTRKAQGLCVKCGSPNDNGHTTCETCKKLHKELMRYRRDKLHAQGRCIGCGGDKNDKSFRYCEKCRAKEAQKMVTKKRNHKKKHTCYVCGSKELHRKTNGKLATYCRDCREKILEQQKIIRQRRFQEELKCK